MLLISFMDFSINSIAAKRLNMQDNELVQFITLKKNKSRSYKEKKLIILQEQISKCKTNVQSIYHNFFCPFSIVGWISTQFFKVEKSIIDIN